MWPHLVRRSARPEAVESLRSRFYSVPQPPVVDHQAAWLSSWSIALATNAPTTLRSIYWRQKKTFGYWHSHDRWKLAYMSVALTHAPQWVAAVTFVCLCSKTGITKAFFDGIWRPPVWCSDMWTFFTSHAELICASFNKNVHFISNTPFPQHEQWMTPSGDAPRNDRSVDTTHLQNSDQASWADELNLCWEHDPPRLSGHLLCSCRSGFHSTVLSVCSAQASNLPSCFNPHYTFCELPTHGCSQ